MKELQSCKSIACPSHGNSSPVRIETDFCVGKLKKQCTVLAVSHDLRELIPLVDKAWRMEPGGVLKPSEWPPAMTTV